MTVSASSEPGLRRPALQARSRANVERILESAGRCFDEVGVEATTMDGVATRSGLSHGAVYRFFEDRAAIVVALADRWERRSLALFGELYSDQSLGAPSPNAIVSEFLVRLERLLDELPGARGLLTASLMATTPPTEHAWHTYVERFLERYAPDLEPSRREAAAHTYITITSALMVDVARAGPAQSTRLAEAHSVLTGYIRQLASESSKQSGPQPR